MRSRVGYVIGGALVVAGIAGAVLWFVGSLAQIGDEVDEFTRVAAPGSATVRLEARKYVVYYERGPGDPSERAFRIEVVDTRTGARLPIASYGGRLTYSLSGHSGAARATVTPAHAGTYEVRTDTEDAGGGNVALGRSVAWPIVRSIVGALAIGALLVGAGVTLLVVTAVRRSRARRPLERQAGTWSDDAMATSGNTGPLGRPRGVGFVLLLFVVTFGIYSLYWAFKSHEEIKEHSGEGVGGVLGLVIWLLINPVTAFLLPSEIGKMYAKEGQQPPVTGWTGLWLFPGGVLVIPAIVWLVKVQRALNRYWTAKASASAAVA